jgi:hypothetical protein
MISDLRPKHSNARAQKSALISFVKSHTWHLFGTIGVGHCPNDNEVTRRLRLIEARLNKKFLCVAYHKLTETEGFRIFASFEGVRDCGNRHCHFLVYCDVPPQRPNR